MKPGRAEAKAIVKALQLAYRGGWGLVSQTVQMAMCEAQVLRRLCCGEYDDALGGVNRAHVEAVRAALLDCVYPEDAARRAKIAAAERE